MIAGRFGVAATHAVDCVLAADLCVTCVLKSMLTRRLPQLKNVVDRNIILRKATIQSIVYDTGVYQAYIKHISSLFEVKTFLLTHPAADQKKNLSGNSRSWIV